VNEFTCLRVPNFWLWSHRRLSPQGELLIVQGQRVLACSPGLSLRGVQVGMTVAAAEGLTQALPLRRLAVDYGCADRAWEELIEGLYRYTPFLLPQPPDMCWAQLDLEQTRALVRQLGLAAGLASDRSTAQLAALLAEPGQWVQVAPGQETSFADQVPLPLLGPGGVSTSSLERLHWLGFSRVGELRRLNRSQLQLRFHEGELLYQLSRPGSRQALGCWAPPEERVGEALCEPGAPLQSLFGLALQRAHQLLVDQLVSRITVELEYEQGVEQAARWLKQPTAQARKLALAAQPLWQSLQREQPPERIRLRLGGLRTPLRQQGSLWLLRPSIQGALQQLQQRFPGVIKKVAWHPGAEGVSEESWSFA
jgi:hypothetical protein